MKANIPTHREALALALRRQDKAWAEIGRVLGCNSRAVKSLHDRALLKELRRQRD